MRPNGSTAPRFRAYRPQVSPPPPSRLYRADPGYAAGGTLAVEGDTIRRAHANRRAWEDHYSQVTNQVTRLAGRRRPARPRRPGRLAGLPAGRPGHRRRPGCGRGGEGHGHRRGAPSGRRCQRLPGGDRPATGRARRDRRRAEGRGPRGRRRAGRRGRQPSPPAVGESVAAGRLARSPPPGRATRGPDAEQAAAWLRAKLNPPPTSSADPIGWAGT